MRGLPHEPTRWSLAISNVQTPPDARTNPTRGWLHTTAIPALVLWTHPPPDAPVIGSEFFVAQTNVLNAASFYTKVLFDVYVT